MERTAQCHCGALKVITTGEPVQIYLCHCQSCQRRTGSVAHCGARFLKSQIRVEGDHKIYTRKGDSGFSPRFHFCPNCGSNVFTESDRAPDLCIITVGSFADPDFPAPTASIYEETGAPLVRSVNSHPSFPARFSARQPRLPNKPLKPGMLEIVQRGHQAFNFDLLADALDDEGVSGRVVEPQGEDFLVFGGILPPA